MLKKSLISAAVAASLFALAAPASATLTSWYLDTDGVGGNAAVLIEDYLDLTGTAYVHNTFSSPAAFTFNEVGNFLVLSADGTTLLNPTLSAKFVGTGSGSVGGPLLFTPGGSLSVFSGATGIADFVLQVGSAVLDSGTVLPNGDISFIFKATGMQTGYFFDEYMNDLASVANSATGLVLGFATTNVISLANGARTVSSTLQSDYNAAFDPNQVGSIPANTTTDLLLSNNGQFRLQVPEPSMLGLFGLALLGAGFASRRKSKSTVATA